ncbi:hypothetical protein KC332_g13482 [Hortaea werneckii]|uniref:Uncharacterized protein n=2 Tax=Hortaea werneckii TaxID=91943 RepID=A0A3M7GMK9_HORWE|nr:hypothetical protein KC358_g16304 [Hortaea werneckii]OTA24280.1 hypothetical protein BTJ68_13026 [Hortaea werneckii EXF-2000]KAI6798079.1 hypothetical protein KC350_g16439 [Hortaea werneckii]KAI6900925.1 hypothetical protein KC348_g16647 [Hortaea werneckii]KAI6925899.1 hypothetical protein KC341_g13121 [Hortaea werneckii]
MPMVWNAETDAKLLSAILQVYDVKINGVKLAEVAALMGPECTPKALTHRLAKFRSLAKTTDAGDDATTKPVPAGSKATKATKGGNKKTNGQGQKKGGRTPSPNVDDETAGVPTPPPSGRPQRQGAKRDYAQLAEGNQDDEEDDGLDKKVKIEVGEDIGEGLRQTNDDTDEELEGAGLLS